MQEPPQIKNPSITLYPFHLRDDGDEGYSELVFGLLMLGVAVLIRKIFR